MAVVLGGVLLFVVIAGPIFGAESRPAWRRVDRKPSFHMVGSMRREECRRSELTPAASAHPLHHLGGDVVHVVDEVSGAATRAAAISSSGDGASYRQ